jgi:hypothetical protein
MGRPRHARRPPGRSCDVKSDDRDGTHEDTAQGSEYESKPLGSIEPGHNTATVWPRGRCYRWDTPLTGHAPLHQDRSRRRGPRAPLVRPGDVFPWSRRDNPQGAGDQRTHHASPLSQNRFVVDRLRPLMRLSHCSADSGPGMSWPECLPVAEAVPGEPRQPHRHLPPPASDLSAQKIGYSLNHEAFLGYTD